MQQHLVKAKKTAHAHPLGKPRKPCRGGKDENNRRKVLFIKLYSLYLHFDLCSKTYCK